MIFSRNRGGGRHVARRRERDEFGPQADGDDEPGGSQTTGPYDAADAPADVERLDLGGLHVAVPPGVELRVQADESGQIQQVLLVSDDSALQLGVFAAPRTEGIWDEFREDIRKQLSTDGVAVEEAEGRYGPELRARVRGQDGLTDVRVVGVDGPRWMVRAVYQGAAAVDPTAAAPLDAALAGLVVERGSEAMPVREPLPLRLPREVAEQAEAQRAAGSAADTGVASVDGTDQPSPTPRPTPGPAPAGRGGASGRRKPSPRPRRG